MLVLWGTVDDVRPGRRCPALGPGDLIDGARERLIAALAQKIMTRCFEQRSQHEQEGERESAGGSDSHG